jgi:hypothetical protein
VVCKDFLHTTQHGAIKGKLQEKKIKYYNLDVIISVGYRVKSKQGTQFRQWATQRLKEYLVKGYALNEKRLKELDYKYTEIKVKYDTQRIGAFTKTVTIVTNEKTNNTHTLTIKGTVEMTTEKEGLPTKDSGVFNNGKN